MEVRIVDIFLLSKGLEVSVVLELLDLILGEGSVENLKVLEELKLCSIVSDIDVEVGKPGVGSLSLEICEITSHE